MKKPKVLFLNFQFFLIKNTDNSGSLKVFWGISRLYPLLCPWVVESALNEGTYFFWGLDGPGVGVFCAALSVVVHEPAWRQIKAFSLPELESGPWDSWTPSHQLRIWPCPLLSPGITVPDHHCSASHSMKASCSILHSGWSCRSRVPWNLDHLVLGCKNKKHNLRSDSYGHFILENCWLLSTTSACDLDTCQVVHLCQFLDNLPTAMTLHLFIQSKIHSNKTI